VRKQLNYGEDKEYKPEIDVGKDWDFTHKPPGSDLRRCPARST
jgi:hypothetical protein